MGGVVREDAGPSVDGCRLGRRTGRWIAIDLHLYTSDFSDFLRTLPARRFRLYVAGGVHYGSLSAKNWATGQSLYPHVGRFWV